MKFCVLIVLAALSRHAQSGEPGAQNNSSNASGQTGAVLIKLSPPFYPPLARLARIMGDVTVKVNVRPDGTVASAEALSGHRLLAPGAVDIAKKSEFECRGCAGETEYILTYTFGFIEDLTPYNKFADRPVRAGKCMYLWKCGTVRVNTFDLCSAHLPPETTESPGHVTILAFPACVETMYSMSAS